MYYKIVYDGCVVDVMETLSYITQNEKNHGIIGTTNQEKANGILSSDGSEIWHIDGTKNFVGYDFKTVSVVEIEKDEYLTILESISEGKTVVEPEKESPIDVDDETPAMTRTDMVDLIRELKEQVKALEACILDMSTAIYS